MVRKRAMRVTTSDRNRAKLGGVRIPRWPSAEDSREIRVNLSSWAGYDPDAKHYNATIIEENNQWWCEEEGEWLAIEMDSRSRGYYFDGKLMSLKEAEAFAKHCIGLIQKGNKKQKYEIKWNELG